MRIQEMLFREDFYPILKETVERFFSEKAGESVNLSYDSGEGLHLIINSKLGFISTFPSPKGLREFLLSEYNIRGAFLKYVIGKLVALGVSTFPIIGRIRDCYIAPPVINKNIFIYPQNRSIRFFNYQDMVVDCVVKSGFTNRFFNNQLEFRKSHSYDFMIPLIEYGNGWFREPIMKGNPLARTTNKEKYKNSFNEAIEAIGKLADDTCENVEANAYLTKLAELTSKKLCKATSQKLIKTTDLVKELIHIALKWAESAREYIPTVMSHGDFQAGNIWVDNCGKTWIYDWETVDRRSIWYDRATLCYSLRRAQGWKDFVKSDLSEIRKRKFVTDCIFQDYMNVKGTVLLEDILFYLDDMLELPEDWGSEIFDVNMRNIAAAVLDR